MKRQSISVCGAATATGDAAFMQTVGQPYNTFSSSGNPTAVLQGFQQPVFFKLEAMDKGPSDAINFTVFPNPAAYSVTLRCEESIENSSVKVTDINGRIILSEKVSQLHEYEISCGKWNNGIYIITVSCKDQSIFTYKLTINK